MKKALLFSIMLVGLQHFSAGQWVTIPDPNFVSYLNTIVPGCISGNQLDTTCSLVTNLNSINCTNQNISSLDGIQYFDNLNYLKCSSNNITTLNSLPFSLDTLICEFNDTLNLGPLPLGLKYLNCAHNDMFSLPVLPSTLYYLNCKTNNLTALPALPNGLTFMDCSMNDISVLPALPNTLGYLDCSTNMISSIGNLPGNLYYLGAAYLQLTSLPTLPASLTSLYVQSNQLATLPPLPSQLIYFTCNENLLTSIPALPSTLFDFRCEFNSITSLPALPNGLRKLYCQDNDLTSLPALPDSLWELVCGLNQLSLLPNLPPVLKYIQCNGNQLTTLPPIPESVISIMAFDNQLTALPSLPDTLAALYIQNNPMLNCLPELPSCQAILFYNTGVQCLPNYPVVGFSNPQINSLPLCGMFNVNSCDFYYNISGTVFSDANTNCLNDFTEAGLPGIKLNLTQGASVVQQNYSTQGGLYTFKTPFGVYDYFPDTSGVPYITICPVSGVQTSNININDSIDNGMDFGLICKAGIDLGTSSINRTSGMFFPGDSANLQCISGDLARLYSLICANGISGTVTVNFTGPVQFSTYPPGSLSPTVSPNTLTYSISDFGSVDIFSAFRFSFITDISAQAGQQVCITVTVSPSNNDLYPVNNIYTHCFTVVNSYDPNIKEANPIGFTTPDNWITYTIHFQNTGTAPAQHIVITDTLDADLQEGTFAFLASSHQPFVNVTGNVIKFTFPNINLPDSTSNEPGSHGWVQYKVKSDPGLALGTTIENTANIYFDFNPPVITNTTVNTVVLPTGVYDLNDDSFEILPNPAGDVINIVTMNDQYRTLNIYDISGRKILTTKLNAGRNHQIDINHLINGTYIAEIVNDKGLRIKSVLIKL